MTKTIQIDRANMLSIEEADALMGHFLDSSHYDTLIDYDADVLKPNGEPLIIFRREVLEGSVCHAAYKALRKVAVEAGNRGIAAGLVQPDEFRIINRPAIKATKGAKFRLRPIKKDGTLSGTSYGKMSPSGIIGYMDPNARFPYCRQTAFNMREPEKFAQALPFIKAINKVFKEECPERYAAQLQQVKATPENFIIHKTCFSTITVNKNFRTAAHKDKGDYKKGFGVMSTLCAGFFEGCYLIFPRYRVAVNMRSSDVCLADVHQVHGNSPFVGVDGAYERISCVCYYRSKMIHCLNPEAELEKVLHRKRGDKLF